MLMESVSNVTLYAKNANTNKPTACIAILLGAGKAHHYALAKQLKSITYLSIKCAGIVQML